VSINKFLLISFY